LFRTKKRKEDDRTVRVSRSKKRNPGERKLNHIRLKPGTTICKKKGKRQG